jgi:hypothetical protein
MNLTKLELNYNLSNENIKDTMCIKSIDDLSQLNYKCHCKTLDLEQYQDPTDDNYEYIW